MYRGIDPARHVLSIFVFLSVLLHVSAHSWIDNIAQVSNLSNIGYIRGYEGHVDGISSNLIQSNASGQLLCRENQRTATYSLKYPMLCVPAGSSIVANYSENGHTTKDTLPPEGKPRPGTYQWFMAKSPSTALSTFGDAHNGDLASVSETGDFDDGLCAEDATRGRAGPRQCQSFLTLPDSMSAGTYQLVWLWTFPKVDGVLEMYSSCLDVEIVDGAASSAAPVAKPVVVVNAVAAGPVAVAATEPTSTTTATVTRTTSVTTLVTPDAATGPTLTTVGATGTMAPGIYTLRSGTLVPPVPLATPMSMPPTVAVAVAAPPEVTRTKFVTATKTVGGGERAGSPVETVAVDGSLANV